VTEPPAADDRDALRDFRAEVNDAVGHDFDERLAALRDLEALDVTPPAPGRPRPAGARPVTATTARKARAVVWWAEATDEELDNFRRSLERFVEWLIAVYNVPATVIPNCWQDHPDLVHELWALERLHHRTHADPNDPSGPNHFTGTWAIVRDRLHHLYANACSDAHQVDLTLPDAARAAERTARYLTSADERAWAWPPTSLDTP